MADHSVSRPEPILSRQTVGMCLGLLAAALVHFDGGRVSDWIGQNSDWIAGAILTVASLVSSWLARGKVTPIEDPRDSSGIRLVPAVTALQPAVPAGEGSTDHEQLGMPQALPPLADK